MNCDELRKRQVEYLEGTLGDTGHASADAHLAQCSGCSEELEAMSETWNKLGELPQEPPSDALRDRFYSMLDAYRAGTDDSARRAERAASSWWPPVWQLAAAAVILVAGIFGGLSIAERGRDREQMAALREELASMRQLVTLSLLRQESASERLRAMSWSRRLESPDDEVLAALLASLDTDPNVNVRLAAVEALSRFAERDRVRQGLAASLARQDSPLVQLDLVELLARHPGEESTSAIRRLSNSQNLNPVVKQRLELVLH